MDNGLLLRILAITTWCSMSLSNPRQCSLLPMWLFWVPRWCIFTIVLLILWCVNVKEQIWGLLTTLVFHEWCNPQKCSYFNISEEFIISRAYSSIFQIGNVLFLLNSEYEVKFPSQVSIMMLECNPHLMLIPCDKSCSSLWNM